MPTEFFILPYLWQHIKTYWLAYLFALGSAAIAYKVGAGTRANELQASQTTISQLQAQRANNAEQQAMALADAVAKYQQAELKSQLLARQLQQREQQLLQTSTKLKKAIKDAVKNDVGFTGIGPRGLCLYTSALGYSDCDERLSNAAPELLAIPPKPAEPVADSLPAASSITPPTTANGAKH
ncbi:hypothetical protein M5585_25655 [Serratia ureilytica]